MGSLTSGKTAAWPAGTGEGISETERVHVGLPLAGHSLTTMHVESHAASAWPAVDAFFFYFSPLSFFSPSTCLYFYFLFFLFFSVVVSRPVDAPAPTNSLACFLFLFFIFY